MRTSVLILTALLPSAAMADVRGPEGDSPAFRYVYPASVTPEMLSKLYRDDLGALQAETAALRRADGGMLTDDHRTYLAAREAAIERRYAEAREGMN